MAIQIQESTPQNPQPEKWAFFYRQHGSTETSMRGSELFAVPLEFQTAAGAAFSSW